MRSIILCRLHHSHDDAPGRADWHVPLDPENPGAKQHVVTGRNDIARPGRLGPRWSNPCGPDRARSRRAANRGRGPSRKSPTGFPPDRGDCSIRPAPAPPQAAWGLDKTALGAMKRAVVMPGFTPAGGRIAQLVEQLTLNQRVQGSNPCAPTKEIRIYSRHRSDFEFFSQYSQQIRESPCILRRFWRL